MLENTAKQCLSSLELGDLSERKMQAVSRITAVFLTTKVGLGLSCFAHFAKTVELNARSLAYFCPSLWRVL